MRDHFNRNRMKSIQTYAYHFLQGKFAHYFVLFFITTSIMAVIASSFAVMEPYRTPLFAVTYVSSFIFMLEYAMRFFTAPRQYPHMRSYKARLRYVCSFYGFVDFVAMLPWLLTYFFWNTQTVHVIILPYIFIIFKLIRHSRSFRIIGKALYDVKDELITAYTACLILISFTAILMYYVEREAQPEIFQNIGDGFWWSIVTFTTTGYGDIYPITPLGKLLGGILSLIGIAMITIPTGIIGSSFMNVVQQKEKKKVEERARELMEIELKKRRENEDITQNK